MESSDVYSYKSGSPCGINQSYQMFFACLIRSHVITREIQIFTISSAATGKV